MRGSALGPRTRFVLSQARQGTQGERRFLIAVDEGASNWQDDNCHQYIMSVAEILTYHLIVTRLCRVCCSSL